MQTCSFHMRSHCQLSPALNTSNDCCGLRESNDGVIFELKKRVIELEQKESNHNQLNERYKQLQILNDCITEEKFQLQKDIKTCKETLNKQVLSLRDENENLQMVLNDKLLLNKKIFQDKDSIELMLNNQIEKCNEMNSNLEQSMTHLNKTLQENNNLGRIIQSLREVNSSLNSDMNKLNEENYYLNQVLAENKASMKIVKEDNENLKQQLNDITTDYQTNNDALKQIEIGFKKSKAELAETQDKITLLQSDLYDYRTENDCLKKELNASRNTVQSEKNNRNSCEKELNYLNKTMNEFTKELSLFQDQLKNEQSVNQKHFEEKAALMIDFEKMKKNIKLLIKQNENLISVIEGIIVEDEGIKHELNRKKRIEYLIQENKHLIKNSMNDNQINRMSHNNTYDDNNNNYYYYLNKRHNHSSIPKNTSKPKQASKRQLTYN